MDETIPGAEVALKFIKLQSQAPGDCEFFNSEYPYTRYTEYEYDYDTRKMEKVAGHFVTYMDCSDWFYWGTADAEELTDENFHILEETVADLTPLFNEAQKRWDAEYKAWSVINSAAYKEWSDGFGRAKDGSEGKYPGCGVPSPVSDYSKIAEHTERLFCARVRKFRPQGAAYKYIPDVLKALYDAAGSSRDINFVNPKTQDDEYKWTPESDK